MTKNALNKLTTAEVDAARGREKAYKLSDGGGLYLLVNEDGRRADATVLFLVGISMIFPHVMPRTQNPG